MGKGEVTAEMLGEVPLLEGVSLTAREDLLFAAELRTLEAGAVVIRQGEQNGRMHLLIEGELGIHLDVVDGDPIAIIEAGETVGELSLLDGGVASAFVVARTTCRLLSVDEDAFWSLINSSHAFAVRLLVKLSSRLRANNAAVSANIQKRRMYERAAMFDGLTGVHNRRWLDETLHRLVRRLDRAWSSMSIALVDVDHFKRFNDTCGHDAGDHVLTVVAGTMPANLRATDLVARFGGEEFVVIFPDMDLERALAAAERLRAAVEATEMRMPDGRELPGVTISIGVAQLERGQDVPSLLKAADAAMYRAKRNGRNRVAGGKASDVDDR